jgi:hypothetical protein
MQKIDDGEVHPVTISLSTYGEIVAWCHRLDCSEIQLAEAVAAVGYSSDAVQQYLGRRSPPGSPT